MNAGRGVFRGYDCDLDVSPAALDLFQKLRKNRGAEQLTVLIDDTGCCGFSNVFVTNSLIVDSSSWIEAGRTLGIPVLVNRRFRGPNEERSIVLDVVTTSSDDSFSLETAYGKRFVIRSSPRSNGADVNLCNQAMRE